MAPKRKLGGVTGAARGGLLRSVKPLGGVRGAARGGLLRGMTTGPRGVAVPRPTAAPIAPTSAPPPSGTPRPPAGAPPDPLYLQQAGPGGSLERARDTTLGDLSAGRARGLGEYGYTETNINPVTGIGTPVFDPNNPFSKASLLKQNYDRSRRQSAQTMGASGQLYSGAFQNQQDYVNRGQLQGEDTLQKSLIDFLAGNVGQVRQARSDYEIGMQGAEADRLARIKDNPLYQPDVSTPDVTTAKAVVATPAAAALKKPLGGVTGLARGGLMRNVKPTKKRR